MSVDNRIVNMVFNNSQFEQGVAQTEKSLDSLKKSLNFTDSAKGFANLEKAASNVSFEGLTNAVQTVELQFSAMSIAAITAIQNIVNRAVDAGVELVKSLSVDQIAAGWDKYAQKTSAVQTIMVATEDTWEEEAKAVGYTGDQIGYVESQIEKLNWYTDETSYALADMVTNISRFTSAGQGLDPTVTAMIGIGNAAGLAGAGVQNASHAMEGFSKAMGQGFMDYRNWSWIKTSKMDTVQLKKSFIEAAEELGTLKKTGEGTWVSLGGRSNSRDSSKLEVTVANFTNALTDGWLNSKVMMKALQKYGKFTEDLYKVYEVLNENSDEYVTTSSILEMVDAVDAGTASLDDYEEMAKTAGMSTEEFMDALRALASEEYKVGRRAFKASQEAKTFVEAIDSVKDAVSTGWTNTFELIFGNYLEAKDLWTNVANELYDLFAESGNIRNDLLREWKEKGGRDLLLANADDNIGALWRIFYNIRDTANAIKETFHEVFGSISSDDLISLTERFKAFTERISFSEESIAALKSAASGMFSLFKAGKDVISAFVKPLGNLFKSSADGVNAFTYFLDSFGNFTRTIATSVSESDKLQKISKFIGDFASRVRKAIDTLLLRAGDILNWLSGVENPFRDLFSSLDGGEKIMSVLSKGVIGLADAFHMLIFGTHINRKTLDGVETVLGELAPVMNNIVSVAGRFKSSIKGLFAPFTEIVGEAKVEWLSGFTGLFDEVFGNPHAFDTFSIGEKLGYGLSEAFLRVANALKTLFTGEGFNEGDYKFIEGVMNVTQNYLIPLLDNLVKAAGSVWDGFKTLQRLFNLWRETGDEAPSISDKIERSFVGAIVSIGNVFSNLFTGEGLSQETIDKIGSFVHTVINFFKRLKDELEPITTTIGEWIKKLFEKFKDFAKPDESGESGLKKFFENIKRIFGPALNGIFSFIKKLIELVSEMIRNLGPGIAKGISGVADFLGKIIDSLLELVKNGNLTEIGKIFNQGILATIGIEIAQFIKSFGSGGKAGSSISGVTSTINTILGMFGAGKENTDNLLQQARSFAISITLLAASALVLSSIKSEALLSSVTALSMLIGETVASVALLNGVEGAGNGKKATSGLITFAAAVLVLSIALKTIASIDEKKMAMAVASISAIFVELMAIMALINTKFKKDGGSTSKATAGLIGMSISLLILCTAVKKLGKMDENELTQGLVAVGLLLGGLSAIVYLLNGKNILSVGASFIAIATSMLILVGAIALLAKVDFVDAVGAAGILVTLAALMAGAVAAFSNIKPQEIASVLSASIAFIAIANSLVLVAGAIALLSVTDIGKTAISTGLLVATLAAIAGAIILLGKFGGGKALLGTVALVAAVGALVLLSTAVAALTLIPTEKLASTLGIITGGLLALVGVAALIGATGLTGALLGLGAAMLMISAAAALFGVALATIATGLMMMNAAQAASTASSAVMTATMIEMLKTIIRAIPEFVAELVVALAKCIDDVVEAFVLIASGVLKGLVTLIPQLVDAVLTIIVSVLTSIANNIGPIVEQLMLILVNAIFGLTAHLPELLSATTQLFLQLITGLLDVLSKFTPVEIAKAMVGLGVLSILLTEVGVVVALAAASTALLPSIGKNLSEFNENVTPFLEGMTDVDPASLEGFVLLAGMIKDLAEASLIDAVSRFLGGPKWSDFGARLIEFAPYMKRFSQQIKGIDSEAVTAAAEAGQMIAAFASSVPASGGILQKIIGENDIVAFAKQLVLFAPDFVTFANSVKGVAAEDVENAANAGIAIANFADSIPKSGGLLQLITGENDIAEFAKQLAVFGPNLMKFAGTVKDLDASSVENAVTAATLITDFTKNVPISGEFSIEKFINGTVDLSAFGQQLVDFAPKLVEFSNAVADVKPEQVLGASQATLQFVEIMDRIDRTGGIDGFKHGNKSLANLGTEIWNLGLNLGDFQNAVVNVDLTRMDDVLTRVRRFADLAWFLENINGSLLGSFGEEMTKLGKFGVGEFVDAFSDGTKDLRTEATKFADAGLSGARSKNPQYRAEGKTAINEYLNAFNGAGQRAEALGKRVVEGLVRGLLYGLETINRAATRAADKVITAMEERLSINSPSKEAMRIGMFVDQGLANGLSEYSNLVSNSADQIAITTVDAMRESIAIVNDLMSADDTLRPVIQPVLDLTDVTNGSRGLYGLMNSPVLAGIRGGTYNVRTDLTDAVLSLQENQNGRGIAEQISLIRNDLNALSDSIGHIQLVMDTGVVAGELAYDMDTRLGKMAMYKGRRN